MKIINPNPYEKIEFDKFPNHLEFFDEYPKYYPDYFNLYMLLYKLKEFSKTKRR